MEFLASIAQAFPSKINYDWLLTGEGEMLLDQQEIKGPNSIGIPADRLDAILARAMKRSDSKGRGRNRGRGRGRSGGGGYRGNRDRNSSGGGYRPNRSRSNRHRD